MTGEYWSPDERPKDPSWIPDGNQDLWRAGGWWERRSRSYEIVRTHCIHRT